MNYDNAYGGGHYDPYSSNTAYAPDAPPDYDTEATPLTTIPPERRVDPYAILNQCQDVRQGVTRVKSYIDKIEALQKRLLLEADLAAENEVKAQAENLSEEVKAEYRALIERMRVIKGTPGAAEEGNARHIRQVESQLKEVIEDYQKMQREYRKGVESQVERQYRIVKPDATDAEVREAIESAGDQQMIFSEALVNSDRRGAAQKVSALVRQRHDDMQKIERDFIELSELFTDLNNMVVAQEPAVEKINEQSAQVVENVRLGTQQVETAIESGKARNRKKWWCVLIILLIIIVIVIIVVVVVVVNKSGDHKKLKF
ncbi:Plasma membrane t-SNARE, secretory vesicle fusion [Ascosphaera acerosa]|nr:Plasma membrane t-SNARE, secretory vesicle fusion [Ascosphaera acerosa]